MIFLYFTAVKKNMTKIILYADQGVDGESLNHLTFTLKEMLGTSHYSLQKMDAKTLIEEPWEKQASLLIIPGGRDIFYHSLLNGRGTDKIRSFIEKGGKYLGICAGAYFACKSIEFEKGGLLEICASRSLQFFPGVAVGPVYGLNKFSYENGQGAEAAKISWKNENCHIYFNGGCTFVAEKQFPGVKTISRYLDLAGHPPSMLEIEIGKGLVFLSGVHFEYSTKLLKKRDRSFSRLYPLLSQSEMKRKIVFKEIMNSLGIELFQKNNDKCLPFF
jgi:glutamine amidotransferase-like uncharacterized protein